MRWTLLFLACWCCCLFSPGSATPPTSEPCVLSSASSDPTSLASFPKLFSVREGVGFVLHRTAYFDYHSDDKSKDAASFGYLAKHSIFNFPYWSCDLVIVGENGSENTLGYLWKAPLSITEQHIRVKEYPDHSRREYDYSINNDVLAVLHPTFTITDSFDTVLLTAEGKNTDSFTEYAFHPPNKPEETHAVLRLPLVRWGGKKWTVEVSNNSLVPNYLFGTVAAVMTIRAAEK